MFFISRTEKISSKLCVGSGFRLARRFPRERSESEKVTKMSGQDRVHVRKYTNRIRHKFIFLTIKMVTFKNTYPIYDFDIVL